MAEKGVGYIFGIIGLVMAFFIPFAGVVLGIIGLVQNRKEKGEFAKKAKILNILAIVVGVLIYIASVLLVSYSGLYQSLI